MYRAPEKCYKENWYEEIDMKKFNDWLVGWFDDWLVCALIDWLIGWFGSMLKLVNELMIKWHFRMWFMKK
jgi:hypothetical protein